MTRLRVALVFGRLADRPARAALDGALTLDVEAYEHTVIAGAAGLSAMARAAGLRVVRVPGSRALAGVLAAGEYDIVHTHGGTAGRLAAARAGIPRIVHTWHEPPRPGIGEHRAARHTDAFLAVGAESASRALRLGLATPDRLRAIWPAMDLRRPGSTRARARHLLGLPLGARVVGCAGPVKRPDVFARAIARLPQDVYGIWTGAPAQRPFTERIAGRLGAGERLGRAAHGADGMALLAGIDVLVLSGHREGLPYLAVEAAAAGVPLVGTLAACLTDIIRTGETGLLTPPGDPGRLSCAIGYLLDNPAEARRMSHTALKRLGDRCSPALHAVTLDETYRGWTRRSDCT